MVLGRVAFVEEKQPTDQMWAPFAGTPVVVCARHIQENKSFVLTKKPSW